MRGTYRVFETVSMFVCLYNDIWLRMVKTPPAIERAPRAKLALTITRNYNVRNYVQFHLSFYRGCQHAIRYRSLTYNNSPNKIRSVWGIELSLNKCHHFFQKCSKNSFENHLMKKSIYLENQLKKMKISKNCPNIFLKIFCDRFLQK